MVIVSKINYKTKEYLTIHTFAAARAKSRPYHKITTHTVVLIKLQTFQALFKSGDTRPYVSKTTIAIFCFLSIGYFSGVKIAIFSIISLLIITYENSF